MYILVQKHYLLVMAYEYENIQLKPSSVEYKIFYIKKYADTQ